VKLLTLEHMLLFSDQPRRLQRFYEDLFGHRVTWASEAGDDPTWIHLTGGRSYLSIFRRRTDPPQAAGFQHMGWVVDDLPAFREHLAARGVTIHRDLVTREADHVYLYDPDRHEVELVHYHAGFASPSNPASLLERLNHVRLTVADLAASVAFYTEVLGFGATWLEPLAAANRVHLHSSDSYLSLSLAAVDDGADDSGPPRTPRFLHAGWVAHSLPACQQQLDDQQFPWSVGSGGSSARLYLHDSDGDPSAGPSIELSASSSS